MGCTGAVIGHAPLSIASGVRWFFFVLHRSAGAPEPAKADDCAPVTESSGPAEAITDTAAADLTSAVKNAVRKALMKAAEKDTEKDVEPNAMAEIGLQTSQNSEDDSKDDTVRRRRATLRSQQHPIPRRKVPGGRERTRVGVTVAG